jgi:hypothetical protein
MARTTCNRSRVRFAYWNSASITSDLPQDEAIGYYIAVIMHQPTCRGLDLNTTDKVWECTGTPCRIKHKTGTVQGLRSEGKMRF